MKFLASIFLLALMAFSSPRFAFSASPNATAQTSKPYTQQEFRREGNEFLREQFKKANAACSANFERLVASPYQSLVAGIRGYNPERPALFAAQYFYHLSTAAVPSVSAKFEGNFWDKGKQLLVRGAKGSLRLLFPVPIPRKRTEAEGIFLKLWKNPSFEPTADEQAILRESGTSDLFEGRKKFLLANPKGALVRPAAGFGAAGLLYLNAAAALNQAKEMSENTLPLNTYVDSPNEDADGKPTVQLIVETTPFPHTALRIGDKVYSYGQQYMTSRGFAEYALGAAPDANSSGYDKNSYFYRLTTAGTKGLERAMRVTDLNLTPEQVNRLRRELEMNTGKAYDNRTFINDCATMIKRALEANSEIRIPGVIDPLPSVSSAYLSMRKALGDSQVGTTKMVLENVDPLKNQLMAARNAYIGMMEGKIALATAAYNLPVRGYMELFKTEDELQFHTPEIKAEIQKWVEGTRSGMQQEIAENLGGANYLEKLKAIPNKKERMKRTQASRNLLNSFIERNLQEAKEILAFPRAEFQQIVVSTEKVEMLEKIRIQALGELDRILRDK